MTNNIKALDFNGVKVKIDTNTKLKLLFGQTTPGMDSYTLHDRENNTNYQVPVGKKATVIYIIGWQANAASHKLIYADNVDGNTNSVDIYVPNSTANESSQIFISSVEVPATKYINSRQPSGASNYTVAPEFAVIEEDA